MAGALPHQMNFLKFKTNQADIFYFKSGVSNLSMVNLDDIYYKGTLILEKNTFFNCQYLNNSIVFNAEWKGGWVVLESCVRKIGCAVSNVFISGSRMEGVMGGTRVVFRVYGKSCSP